MVMIIVMRKLHEIDSEYNRVWEFVWYNRHVRLGWPVEGAPYARTLEDKYGAAIRLEDVEFRRYERRLRKLSRNSDT